MSETKKPTDDKAKTTPKEEKELSEEQLEQVAGGAFNAYLKDIYQKDVAEVTEAGTGGGGGAGKIPPI